MFNIINGLKVQLLTQSCSISCKIVSCKHLIAQSFNYDCTIIDTIMPNWANVYDHNKWFDSAKLCLNLCNHAPMFAQTFAQSFTQSSPIKFLYSYTQKTSCLCNILNMFAQSFASVCTIIFLCLCSCIHNHLHNHARLVLISL